VGKEAKKYPFTFVFNVLTCTCCNLLTTLQQLPGTNCTACPCCTFPLV